MQTQRHDLSPARDAYRRKYEAEIQQWEAKLASLKAESEKWTADAKLAFSPHVEKVERGMSTAKSKLERIADVTEEKWEELQADVESTWEDVKAKLQGAYDAVANHKKN